jgi:hypothetical protein
MSTELRKLVEKKGGTAKKGKPGEDSERRSSTPPKGGPLDFSDDEGLGRRHPRSRDLSPIRDDNHMKAKRLKVLEDSRSKTEGRLLLVLPDTTFHLKHISTKKMASLFGNPYIPVLPTSFVHSRH